MNVVVTGALGALGSSVVSALRRRRCSLVLIDNAKSGAKGDDTLLVADLSDPESARLVMTEAANILQRIDAVVHLVGAFHYISVVDSNSGDWRALFTTNVETAVNAIQAALPYMGDGSSVTCVCAASAQPAKAGMGPYAAAKSGLARLVEALSEELKPRRIRVNAVAPAIIDTPRNRADMPSANPTDWTPPDAIADVVGFLMGPEARAINGVILPATNNG